MRNSLLLSAFATLLILISIPGTLCALPIEVEIETSLDPAAVVGLVIHNQGTREYTKTTVRRGDPETLIVSFEIEKADIRPESIATAMMFTAANEVLFANAKPASNPALFSSYLSIPDCPAPDGSQVALMGKSALLEKLIAIRTHRLEKRAMQVQEVLSGELLASLTKLEDGFGYSYEEPLSPALSPEKLIFRLSRIKQAVELYKGDSAPAPNE